MSRKKMGRPKIELKDSDWEQLEKMAQIHCTGEEMADILGMSYDTLKRRVEEAGFPTFADWYKMYSSGGKRALRRYQFDQAKKSAAMAIWLGKQHLGQRDHMDNLNTGAPIRFVIERPSEQIEGETKDIEVKKIEGKNEDK